MPIEIVVALAVIGGLALAAFLSRPKSRRFDDGSKMRWPRRDRDD